jgi:hypothetical protein
MSAKVLQFISRRTQLRLRELHRVARFVNKYGEYRRPGVMAAARLEQEQLEERQRDTEWNERHGPVPGGARVLALSVERFTEQPVDPNSKHGAHGADVG